jgi:hypothetical protein
MRCLLFCCILMTPMPAMPRPLSMTPMPCLVPYLVPYLPYLVPYPSMGSLLLRACLHQLASSRVVAIEDMDDSSLYMTASPPASGRHSSADSLSIKPGAAAHAAGVGFVVKGVDGLSKVAASLQAKREGLLQQLMLLDRCPPLSACARVCCRVLLLPLPPSLPSLLLTPPPLVL